MVDYFSDIVVADSLRVVKTRHCSELSCGVYIVNLFGIVTGSPVCCGDMMNCGGVVNK